MSNLSPETNLLAAAFQALPVAVITADGHGTILSVNAAFTSLTGYTAADTVGRPVMFLWVDAVDVFDDILREAAGVGESYRGKWVCRTKNAGNLTAQQTVTAIQSPGGEILHVVVTMENTMGSKHASSDLRLSRERLEVAEQATGAGTWFWSYSAGGIEGSLEWLKFHGFDRDKRVLSWDAFSTVLHPEDRARVLSRFQESIERREPDLAVEYRVLRQGGGIRWMGASGRGTYNEAGQLLGVTGVCLDLTERKRIDLCAFEAQRDFDRFFNLIPELACIVSTDGYFKKVNSAWETTLGFTLEEVLNTPMLDFIHPEDLERTLEEIAKQSPTHRTKHFVNRYRCKDGSYRIFDWTTTFNRDESTRFGVARDITEQRAAENAARQLAEQIAYAAEHDVLTGLPNRMLLNDRVSQAIELARRHSRKVSLLFMDLDGFKHINDSLGHLTGDKLLQSISKRLVNCVRTSDTVSRQGGDEFVVLLSEVEHTENTAGTATRILQAVAEPHSIDQHDLYVTASIGVSVYPDDGLDAETLIKNADTAMYHAKENGRQNCQFFQPAMNVRAVERQSIEESLRRALERQELTVHYQPRIDLRTGEVTGAEALLRWTHPSRGQVSPAQFIPVAEDCGLVVPIGKWVLREACQQSRAWVDAGLPMVTIAVNISAMELRNEGFLESVFEILADTGLDPTSLELELTESVLMKHAESATSILTALRARGVQIAVDDFGTGYSSLSYLRKFPVDALKIDRSFVHQITNGSGETTIVTAVISMARSLNLRVVAEGVETLEELAFLQVHQCDEAQGYYFGRPEPPEEFARLLEIGVKETAMLPPSDSFGALNAAGNAVITMMGSGPLSVQAA